MPKQKAISHGASTGHKKNSNLSNDRDSQSRSDAFWRVQFSSELFKNENVDIDRKKYSLSNPYKHGVIDGLIEDKLLRDVRKEILSEIHYTQKETDIYKIHQSGDLANLDGLESSALAKLPSLLRLRDALYSPVFRSYLETVTGCGKLSGSKTDMAINIYTPGSHLLCHDDVIGSRRISYILYLTDPDDPWREEWGGALRLFPTKARKAQGGKISYTPLPDISLSIFPRWNQLSFFAVQPGFSFHDVGEVYENTQAPHSKQPMRAAISGWFHIPQPGEPGFVKGEAEALQKESSLTTLQSSDEQFDFPRPNPTQYLEYDKMYINAFNAETTKKSRKAKSFNGGPLPDWEKTRDVLALLNKGEEDPNFDVLTAEEAEFLIKFINPNFLVPDQVKEMDKTFEETGNVVIENFLRPNFAEFLRHEILHHFPRDMPSEASSIEEEGGWKVARPPHKHRYLVMNDSQSQSSKLQGYLNQLFQGPAFRKWLQLVTSCILKSHDTRIRRFRRGEDYQLAKIYKEKEPRIELTLGLTPEGKWEAPDEDEDEDVDMADAKDTNGTRDTTFAAESIQRHVAVEFEPLASEPASDLTNHGGYEMFIVGDEEDSDDGGDGDGNDDDDNGGDKEGAQQPPVGHKSHLDVTGKQQRKKNNKKTKFDPAIYQASGDDEQDDIRLNVAANFNKLTIALRDRGIMRFVKYVSRRSGFDRWDFTGEYEVDWERSSRAHGWDEDDGGEDDDDDEVDDDGEVDEDGQQDEEEAEEAEDEEEE